MCAEIVSRAEAKAQGLKRYFTGKPCKHGHVDERYVSSGKCAPCVNLQQRVFRKKYPERVAKNKRKYHRKNKAKVREYKLRKNFGISSCEYDEMFAAQGGCCAICKLPAETFPVCLAVDHCHDTGKVRGLLCGNCNRGLGYLQDDRERLRAASRYLERYS